MINIYLTNTCYESASRLRGAFGFGLCEKGGLGGFLRTDELQRMRLERAENKKYKFYSNKSQYLTCFLSWKTDV